LQEKIIFYSTPRKEFEQNVKIDKFWIFFAKEMEIFLQICYNMWSEMREWVIFLIFACVFRY